MAVDPEARRTDIRQNWFTESGRTYVRDGMVIREWKGGNS